MRLVVMMMKNSTSFSVVKINTINGEKAEMNSVSTVSGNIIVLKCWSYSFLCRFQPQ